MVFEALTLHAALWSNIQPMLDKQRLPQALLLVGSLHAGILPFTHRLMAILLCQHPDSAPCGLCQPCHLLQQGTHPDICYVLQENTHISY